MFYSSRLGGGGGLRRGYDWAFFFAFFCGRENVVLFMLSELFHQRSKSPKESNSFFLRCPFRLVSRA